MSLTLHQLLTEKNCGLIHGLSLNRVRWFESTASEGGIDLGDGEDDYDIIVASGIEEGDYVYFRADAKVQDAGIHDEDWVSIKDTKDCRRVFNVYKVLKASEVLAL